MRAQLLNYRGCAKADLDWTGILWMGGKNGNGKTSVVGGLSNALLADALPPGATKKDIDRVLHQGTAMGMVTIASDTGTVRVGYPACTIENKGRSPTAHPISAGRYLAPTYTSFSMIADKARAAMITQILDTEPDNADLLIWVAQNELVDDPRLKKLLTADGQRRLEEDVRNEAEKLLLDFDPAKTETPHYRAIALVFGIRSNLSDRGGWDAAHAAAAETGTKLKGLWEKATGKPRWGANIGEGWLPDGWDAPDDDEITPEQSDAKVEAANTVLEEALKTSGADAGTRERLQALVDKIPTAKEVLKAAVESVTAATTKRDDAQKVRDACLPAVASPPTVPCAHCGEPNVYTSKGGVELLSKPGAPVPETELTDRRRAIAKADGSLNKAKADLATAERDKVVAEEALKECNESFDALGKLQTGEDPATERQALADAIAQQKRVKAKTDATNLHRKIVQNLKLVGMFAPDGVRQATLSRKLGDFNVKLAGLSTAAGWATVSLTDDLRLAFGGRPYDQGVSQSERYRCDVTFQLAVALSVGDPIVLMDGADVMLSDGRVGLIKMLVAHALPAGISPLVTCSYAKPEDLPAILAQKGWGATYWMEAGIAQQTAQKVAA